MLSDTAKLWTELSLRDHGFSSGLNSAHGSLTRFQRVQGITSQGLSSLQSNLTKIAKVGFLGVAGAAAYALHSAAEFQDQLNTINTVAKVSQDKLTGIGDGLRTMARVTGVSLSDLTGAYYDLLSAGIKTADAQNVLTQANHLAIGGLSTNTEAVNVLTTAINAYGGNAAKAKEYTDQLAMAINIGKVKASEIAASFANVALIASHYKIGVDEIAAAYGSLTAQGMAAGDVTVYMRQTINSLIKPTSTLAALEKQTGKSYIAIAGKQGLVVALQMMVDDANKAGVSTADLTGRIQAQQFIAGVTGEKFGAYTDALDKVRHASDGAGEAQKQFDIKQQGLKVDMDRLKQTVHDVAITFGTDLMPAVDTATQGITSFLTKNRDKIRDFSAQLGRLASQLLSKDNVEGGIQKAMTFLRDLPWDDIKSNMQFSARIAKQAVDIFNGLPPELQKALVTMYAANKLTGGAVGSLASEGIKALLGGLKTIYAGNVTVIAGSSVGGGGVPGTGGGTGGGLGGVLTSILGYVGIGSALAVAADTIPADLEAIQKLLNGDAGGGLKALDASQTGSFLKTNITVPLLDALTGGKGTSIVDAIESTKPNAKFGEQLPKGGFQTQQDFRQGERDPKGGILGLTTIMQQQARDTKSSTAILQQQLRYAEQHGDVKTATRLQGVLTSKLNALHTAARDQLTAQDLDSAGRHAEARRLQAKADAIANKAGLTKDAVNKETGVLRSKNFAPTINVNTAVTSNFSVSAVAIVQQIERAHHNFRYVPQ